MVACEECSWPQVTGLRWYRWLELRSRWRRQQYSHFDTACQRPKGKLHFLFAVVMSVLQVISAICRTLFPPSAAGGGGGGDMLILDRGYSLAKLPRSFEGAEKFG